jgi:hypothetical protein
LDQSALNFSFFLPLLIFISHVRSFNPCSVARDHSKLRAIPNSTIPINTYQFEFVLIFIIGRTPELRAFLALGPPSKHFLFSVAKIRHHGPSRSRKPGPRMGFFERQRNAWGLMGGIREPGQLQALRQQTTAIDLSF